MKFSEKIWEWDTSEDINKFRTLYWFAEALEYLSMDVEYQISNPPLGCPSCAIWEDYAGEVQHFLLKFEKESSAELIDAVNNFIKSYENLSEDENKCDDVNIFKLDGWAKVRSASIECLQLIEWDLLKKYKTYIDAAYNKRTNRTN